MTDTKLTGLELLRSPFPENLIGKLPKPLKWQTDCKKEEKTNCDICGQWHHPKVIHLDYVGHAALTSRLLDCDPDWNWEPMAFDQGGLPLFSKEGLWIKLTVCGKTRLGFGDAQGKSGGNAIKEIIGDALRNAAMRFGAALDLWHKGELHNEDYNDKTDQTNGKETAAQSSQQSMWKGPLDKDVLTQKLTELVAELSNVSPKDTEQFLEGLWKDNETILEQAVIDTPRWYDATAKAKRKALETINSFPGDSDPFGLPETDEVGP